MRPFSCCQALLAFLREHRRAILLLIAVAVIASWLGAHTRQVSEPLMCHIYG